MTKNKHRQQDADLKPHPRAEFIIRLQWLTDKINQAGHIDDAIKKEAASDFIDIYSDNQAKLSESHNGLPHQEYLNIVGEMNAFMRVYSQILDKTPSDRQVSLVRDIENEITKNHAPDRYDVKIYHEMMKGIAMEKSALDILRDLESQGNISDVRGANLYEDVDHGFDMTFEKNGLTIRLDIKSHRSYQKLLDHSDQILEILPDYEKQIHHRDGTDKTITAESGVAIKRSHDGYRVLVIDADANGFNGHPYHNDEGELKYHSDYDGDSFSSRFEKPDDFVDALEKGVAYLAGHLEKSTFFN